MNAASVFLNVRVLQQRHSTLTPYELRFPFGVNLEPRTRGYSKILLGRRNRKNKCNYIFVDSRSTQLASSRRRGSSVIPLKNRHGLFTELERLAIVSKDRAVIRTADFPNDEIKQVCTRSGRHDMRKQALLRSLSHFQTPSDRRFLPFSFSQSYLARGGSLTPK